MLGSRDVINLKYAKEVGTSLSRDKTYDAGKSLQLGCPILDLVKWNMFLPGKTDLGAVYLKTTERVSHKNKRNTWNILVKELIY